MNVLDRRRLLGPSNAKFPTVQQSVIQSSLSRSADDIRKFYIQSGLITNANGSAYLEVDDTIIEVAVFGPRPIRGSFIDRASFSVETKFLPYINQPKNSVFNGTSSSNHNGRSGLTNIEQRISTYVETALLSSILLEKYPKSTIDVFINIISFNDNENTLLNLVNWVVNCSSIALVDSGIEIKDIVTSGQVALTDSGDIVLDSGTGHAVEAVVSFMNQKNNEIVGLWIEGDDTGLEEAMVSKLIAGGDEMSKKVKSSISAYLLEQ